MGSKEDPSELAGSCSIKTPLHDKGAVKEVFLPPQNYKGERMKDKQFYFLLGFITAFMLGMVISCSMEPLSAVSSACGEESWNPCYVKVVE